MFSFYRNCSAQGNISGNNQNIILQDTLNEGDSIINENGFFSLFKGKPGKAALYSLVLPGGGQFYNKKWWKAPIAIGIDVGLLYNLTWQAKKYQTYQTLYTASLNDPKADPRLVQNYKSNRDQFRKFSEYAWIYLIAGHLLTVIDAFVDRHLMDFDVSDDLTLIEAQLIGNPLVVKMGLNININVVDKTKLNPSYPGIP
ncbi:MAG: hypothetical protein IPO92_08435 [Saprospiraceae bacterium]|nr:hypothetical protein [Saprospiraceae bacterium]